MIVGYRGWRFARINGKASLLSPIGHTFQWSPVETIAFCPRCSKLVPFMGIPNMEMRTPVAESCSCGLYALRSPEAVVAYFGGGKGIDIIGEVLLYGDIIVGEHGYRAEKAKVGILFLPTIRRISQEDLNDLAKEYNTNFEVTTGKTRQSLEFHRNKLAKDEYIRIFGKQKTRRDLYQR